MTERGDDGQAVAIGYARDRLSAVDRFLQAYHDHMEAWGQNCGALPEVYEEHLKNLLQAHKEATEERVEVFG